jgi:hypothetical protein
MRSPEGRDLAINPDKKITVMGVSQEAVKGMTGRPADYRSAAYVLLSCRSHLLALTAAKRLSSEIVR